MFVQILLVIASMIGSVVAETVNPYKLPGRCYIPPGETPKEVKSVDPPKMQLKAEIPPRWWVPPDKVIPGTMADAAFTRPQGYNIVQNKANKAWAKDARTKGKGLKIAIIDTGAQVDHPWIRENIAGTYNAISKTRDVTDRQGHGTHCADIALQYCPEVEVYVIKSLGDDGSGSVVDIAHGIDYAVSVFKVDVISMSLGGPQADQWIPPALVKAEKAGVLVFAAAGNAGPRDNTDGYPARYPQCISVAATNEQERIADFSSRGRSVFVASPGDRIVAAYPRNRSAALSGTSMACPGAAAGGIMWIATHPEIAKVDRPKAFRNYLKKACSRYPNRDNAWGYGIWDATKLLGSIVEPPKPPTDPTCPGFEFLLRFDDLNENAQKKLRDAGVSEFELRLVVDGKKEPTGPSDKPKVMPGFSWRYLPGVGWGYVQDGIDASKLQPVPFVQPANPGYPIFNRTCPNGACPAPSRR